MTSPDVAALLTQVASQGKHLTDAEDGETRKELVHSVRKLYLALETPIETTLRMVWADRALDSCIQTSIQMKLFEKMSERTPKSSDELATETSSDPALVSRLLNHMAAMDVITEKPSRRYVLTKFTQALILPPYRDAFIVALKAADPAWKALPSFLAKNDYRNPDNLGASAFLQGHQTSEHFFEWLDSYPDIADAFNNHMTGHAMGRKAWTDPGCYPVKERLFDGADANSVMLVDIGGGTGSDINAFYEKFGGKCILEELPDVVEAATPVAGVEVIAHDMFTPQPIQGARAYYLHSVLHDWPDSKCIEVLNKIKPAMKKGYSKVLINEYVVPRTDAYWITTALDILMMTIFSSGQRTEENWKNLFEQVGMKITQIFTYEKGTESLIEAELV